MGTDGTYRTSDLYISAWLLSKGLELRGIDRSNKQRNDFIFQDRPDRPELVNQFLCGSATGNVVDLRSNVAEIAESRQTLDDAECEKFFWLR